MESAKSRVIKVLAAVDSEKEGITQRELARKLNQQYRDFLSFSNFDEFIKMNLLTGRLRQKNEKLYVTERGKKLIEL